MVPPLYDLCGPFFGGIYFYCVREKTMNLSRHCNFRGLR
jgi:hypothetical protein